MAIGSDYNVKQDLIDAVVAKVFKNDTFAVTGEGLQKALCDMIESLWGQAAGGSGGSPNYIDVTYAQLNVHIGAGTLVPGTWYRFDFENVHDVDGSLLANTSIAGYTSVVEKFVVLAIATNKISGFALSEQHKYDVIEYNPTQASHGSPAVLDNGTVIRRYDALNDNEAYFDFRNYTVTRFSLNMSNLFTGSTINRSSVSYDNSNANLYFSVRDAADKSNFRLVQNIEIIKRFPYYSYGAGNIEFFGTTYNMINTPVFTQSFVGTNTGIRLGRGVKDIKITSSTNIKVENDCNAITIDNCENVDVGNDCTNVVLKNYRNSSLGKSNSKIFLFDSYRVDIGKGNSEIIMVNSSDSQIENSTTNILLFDSPYNNIASKCESIFCIRDAQKNVFGLMTKFISLGSSTNNEFGSTCTTIDIYGGGYNRFAQGCNLINLIGEQDDAFTGAGTYYSPYSEMAFNTFGLGCSNINFNYVGGRGNMFGDECKNLSFTGNGTDIVLMNTSFCRGVQNKIFQRGSEAPGSETSLSIINCSFIVPCHESVTIDPFKFYSPVLLLREENRPSAGSAKRYIEVIDSKVANNTVYSVTFAADNATALGLINATGIVTYTSATTGATKATITAGLINKFNQTVGVGGIGTGSAAAMGEGIYISDAGSNRRYAISQSTDNLLVVNDSTGMTNHKHHMAYQGMFPNAFPTNLEMSYEGQAGDTRLTTDNPAPNGSKSSSLFQYGYGLLGYPQGNAFQWTRDGYPLAVSFGSGINKVSAPSTPYEEVNSGANSTNGVRQNLP